MEGADSARLEFVRCIGKLQGGGDLLQLDEPTGIALRPGVSGVETILVADMKNHRVVEYTIEGAFVRIFAGNGVAGSDAGQLNNPWTFAILPAGEVAVADFGNSRVQIFDGESGEYKRGFGSAGSGDGEMTYLTGIAADTSNGQIIVVDKSHLQVFSSTGEHLCTRKDFGFWGGNFHGVAWSEENGLAISDESSHQVGIWGYTA
jgi:DNA-binding beta-propeller fold protein YncE